MMLTLPRCSPIAVAERPLTPLRDALPRPRAVDDV